MGFDADPVSESKEVVLLPLGAESTRGLKVQHMMYAVGVCAVLIWLAIKSGIWLLIACMFLVVSAAIGAAAPAAACESFVVPSSRSTTRCGPCATFRNMRWHAPGSCSSKAYRRTSFDDASRPEDMNLPGFRFHALVGRDKGRYAINASGNWRITFGWIEVDAIDVDLEDYH